MFSSRGRRDSRVPETGTPLCSSGSCRWAWLFVSLKTLRARADVFSRRCVLDVTFAASMVLCLVAANFQIPGFAWQQVADWPRRVTAERGDDLCHLAGRADDLYADCRDSKNVSDAPSRPRQRCDRERIRGRDELPRAWRRGQWHELPAAPGLSRASWRTRRRFRTSTRQYFRSADRPHFVMLCQQATDGRFPTLEDSAALNYVLNNYVPVARDGRFLVLQQRTAEDPAFQLVHEQTLHFGEKLDLSPWAHGPLFMSVRSGPACWDGPLPCCISSNLSSCGLRGVARRERYRIVPSMAERPFLVNPAAEWQLRCCESLCIDPRPANEQRDLRAARVTESFEFQDELYRAALYRAWISACGQGNFR